MSQLSAHAATHSRLFLQRVNEPHHGQHRLDVPLHVGDLDVGNRPAWRKQLELAFQRELGESVNWLGHMDVVGVGDVALVRHALDDSEPALEALGEAVGGGLDGRAVERVGDVLGLPPLGGVGVEGLHDFKARRLALWLGQLPACHCIDAFPKPRVAKRERGVAAMQERVDPLATRKPRKSAVPPQDGGSVGERPLQPLVAALQRPVAQLQPLVQEHPEVLPLVVGGKRHVHEVYRDDALVESPIVFWITSLVHVWRKETAASHAWVAAPLAAGVDLVRLHHLLGDVVRDHPLRSAFGCEAGEVEPLVAFVDIVPLQDNRCVRFITN